MYFLETLISFILCDVIITFSPTMVRGVMYEITKKKKPKSTIIPTYTSLNTIYVILFEYSIQ